MFENKTVLNEEDFILLQNTWEKYKSPFRKFRKMQRVCFVLPGIILILVGILKLWPMVTEGTLYVPMAALSVVFIVLGLLLIFWPTGSGLAKKNWKKFPDKGKVQIFCFAKDRFYQRTESENYELEYSVLKDLMEDKRVFLLFFSDQVAYILHKDGFTSGDADSFRTFLTERTGLTMRQL